MWKKRKKEKLEHLPLGTVGGFFVCTLAVALFTCQINNGILIISRLHLTTGTDFIPFDRSRDSRCRFFPYRMEIWKNSISSTCFVKKAKWLLCRFKIFQIINLADDSKISTKRIYSKGKRKFKMLIKKIREDIWNLNF